MELKTKKISLPHLVTEVTYGGSGHPGTVLTSGGLDGEYAWRDKPEFAEVFASKALFVGWDRRFASRSSGPFSLQSLETNAIDLMHIMDAFGMERANLMGSSYGASTSLTFAYWMPERVNKLVLLHPARVGYSGEDTGRSGRIGRAKALLEKVGVAGALRDKDFIYSFPPERDDFAGGCVADMDPEEFALLLRETVNRVGHLGCPVIGMPASMLRRIEHEAIVFSGNDSVHSPEAAQSLVDLLPNARFTKTPGGEDGLSVEVMEEIAEFLQE